MLEDPSFDTESKTSNSLLQSEKECCQPQYSIFRGGRSSLLLVVGSSRTTVPLLVAAEATEPGLWLPGSQQVACTAVAALRKYRFCISSVPTFVSRAALSIFLSFFV